MEWDQWFDSFCETYVQVDSFVFHYVIELISGDSWNE